MNHNKVKSSAINGERLVGELVVISQNDLELMQTNLTNIGKLSNHTFFRLGLNFQRANLEKGIRDLLNNSKMKTALQTDGKYHLHYSNSLVTPKTNQIHIQLDNNQLMVKFFHKHSQVLTQFELYPFTGSDTICNQSERMQFQKIINKITNGELPTTIEDDFIIQQINTNRNKRHTLHVDIRKPQDKSLNLSFSLNPLLKTMDQYIHSLDLKIKANHINTQMGSDKIAFTQILRTFAENPSQDTWFHVRKAMKEHPRYAFSWTGSSQADLFLTIIKIQYETQISEWDSEYKKMNPKEANTSWGRFIYDFGWMYYIPSFFLAPFKFVNFIFKEYQRNVLQSELMNIRLSLANLRVVSNNKHFTNEANPIIDNLEKYLSESEQVTEEVLSYIDKIDKHIKTLQTSCNLKILHDICSDLKNTADKIKALVDRPIPSVQLNP